MIYVLKLTDVRDTLPQKESKSDFAMEGYHLVGRMHSGDENGNTTCRFARFEVPVEFGKAKIVYVNNSDEIKVKESKSNITLGNGEVIISRSHKGDENGETTYKTAKVFLELENNEERIPLETLYDNADGTDATKTISLKESDGQWAYIEDCTIVGRKHTGDENANTVYSFAKFQFSSEIRTDSVFKLEFEEVIDTAPQSKNNSHFEMEGYHLVGRMHSGDENGKTVCKFAKFKFPVELGKGKFEYIKNNYEIKVKESDSDIILSDGEVIISRSHSGDENGYTTYKTARVIAVLDDGRTFPINTLYKYDGKDAVQNMSVSESAGELAYIENCSIIGIRHKGDENKETVYKFATFVLDTEVKTGSVWKYIMAADAQYGWVTSEDYKNKMASGGEWADKYPKNSDCDYIDDTDKLAQKQVESMNALIEKQDTIKGVMINGDLVNVNGWNVSHSATQLGHFEKYYNEIKRPLYCGLGNHDYGYNIDKTYHNVGANSMVEYIISMYKERGIYNFDCQEDRTNGTKYSGSLSYAYDIGNVHIVQLNYYPDYTIEWNGGGKTVSITNCKEWLKADLKTAYDQGKIILVCMHHFNLKDDKNEKKDNTYKEILTKYGVSAIFVGHFHKAFGKKVETGISIPVFYCGSTSQSTYLMIKIHEPQRLMVVRGVSSRKGVAEEIKGCVTTVKLKTKFDLK